MENLSIKKVLAKLLSTKMVIETGSTTTVPTAGPTTAVKWQWKKYSDGTVECWGSTIATYNLNSGPYGGEYYLSLTWVLPGGLFNETPTHGQISRFNGQGSGGLITASLYNISATNLSIYVYNPTTYNNTIGLSVYLVGTWAARETDPDNPDYQLLNIDGFVQNQMSKAEVQALIEASGNIFKENDTWIPSNLT